MRDCVKFVAHKRWGTDLPLDQNTSPLKFHNPDLTPEKAPSDLGLSGLWTKLWGEFDFSWAGLAAAAWSEIDDVTDKFQVKRWRAPSEFPGTKEVLGEGPSAWRASTLQEYWRWIPKDGIEVGPDISWKDGRLASDQELLAAGALINHEGRLWHLAFLEPSAVNKDEWAKLRQNETWWRKYIDSRLILSRHSEADEDKTNNPAYLALKLSKNGDLTRASPQHSLVLSGVRNSEFYQEIISLLRLSSGARQRVSLLSDYAFISGLDLSGLRFAPYTRFENAYIDGQVRFDGCDFGEGVSYRNATFGGQVTFRGTYFGAGADFREARFGESVSFGASHFEGSASFEGAIFIDDCSFRDAVFHGPTDYSEAVFQGSARFITATFLGEVIFTHSEFSRGAAFRGARFIKRASFGGAGNNPGAIFRKKVSFRTCQFEDYADFSNVIWPSNARDHHGSFEGSRFEGTADFKTKDFCSFSMFDGTDFRGCVLLAEPIPPETSAETLLERSLDKAREAVADDHQVTQRRSRGDRPTPAAELGSDARFGTLAGGLRTLRLAMATQKDVVREQRFNRFELRAKMLMPSEPIAAKLAAIVYGAVSNFGTSIGRPIALAIAALFVFAFAFLGISVLAQSSASPLTANLILGEMPPAFSVAFDRAIPLGVFADTTRGWFLWLETVLDPASVVLVKILAGAETLVVIGLLLLSALALKRRFQVR
ncbi:pentapeptide repeat-containing protein [Asticcacaulis sp.]|uniref:pentapeptide repeat-containing protein n=1 Tax=Asticcacaulis sp. TaxID=1872648 RepID=UPI00391DE082